MNKLRNPKATAHRLGHTNTHQPKIKPTLVWLTECSLLTEMSRMLIDDTACWDQKLSLCFRQDCLPLVRMDYVFMCG